MTIFSSLRPLLQRNIANNVKNTIALREMSGHGPRLFPLSPTRFQWTKFKDMTHFYIMIGLIPVTAVVMYANIFIGPATLTEIPEGYTPKHWEYYRHPITRWLARNLMPNPQQEYEKFMHHVFEEDEKRQLRFLEKAIKNKMQERNDYQAYYYRPVTGKYLRKGKEITDELERGAGD